MLSNDYISEIQSAGVVIMCRAGSLDPRYRSASRSRMNLDAIAATRL
jgi:hypothetical protein